MIEALTAWMGATSHGADAARAVIAAAEAVSKRPWDVVHLAGRLARARPMVAPKDLGLNALLRVVEPTARSAILRVEAGQLYPAFDTLGRRARGAYDTPMDMARRVVRSALRAAEGPVHTGLDPACGTGAFLLAMSEAGVDEVYGTDLDPLAIEVARIAVPRARLLVEDALKHGPSVDLVCGNPPFVPPERQDKALRIELRRRFPWLHGRFDLVVPFAATALDRARPGGGVGLVLPFPALVQPYGRVLRQRWLERHRVVELAGPLPFAGAQVDVGLIVLCAQRGPAPLPSGVSPEELMWLDAVPLDPALRPGDVDLVETVRSRCVPLGELAWVDTGLVAHGPAGGKAALIHDEPGPGRVRYADARGFFAGEFQWLDYQPSQMHRPKSRELFEPPKLVVQRLRGRAPVKAAVDRSGAYVGHTCTVVVPHDPRVDLDGLCALVCSPWVDGVLRIERGQRLDLYPKDVASIPVPVAWLDDSTMSIEAALQLDAAQLERLVGVTSR